MKNEMKARVAEAKENINNRADAIEALKNLFGEEFDWNAPRQVKTETTDYFTRVVTDKLTSEDGEIASIAFIKTFFDEQHQSVTQTMDAIFDIVKSVSGGEPITTREALIAFAAWKLSDLVADMNNNPFLSILSRLRGESDAEE